MNGVNLEVDGGWMMQTHHLKPREEIVPAREYEAQSEEALSAPRSWTVHGGCTWVGLCRLEDGHVETHVHSFEESFYVLEGTPSLYLDGRGVTLLPGACGVVPVGVPHAWRADEERRPGSTWLRHNHGAPAKGNPTPTRHCAALGADSARRA